MQGLARTVAGGTDVFVGAATHQAHAFHNGEISHLTHLRKNRRRQTGNALQGLLLDIKYIICRTMSVNQTSVLCRKCYFSVKNREE
jgi:hypothetical protein